MYTHTYLVFKVGSDPCVEEVLDCAIGVLKREKYIVNNRHYPFLIIYHVLEG